MLESRAGIDAFTYLMESKCTVSIVTVAYFGLRTVGACTFFISEVDNPMFGAIGAVWKRKWSSSFFNADMHP